MKIYSFSFVGSCTNDHSYCYDTIPTVYTGKQGELKEIVSTVRDAMTKDHKDFLKKKLRNHENHTFGLVVTTIDINKDTAKNRRFKINPNKLRYK